MVSPYLEKHQQPQNSDSSFFARTAIVCFALYLSGLQFFLFLIFKGEICNQIGRTILQFKIYILQLPFSTHMTLNQSHNL